MKWLAMELLALIAGFASTTLHAADFEGLSREYSAATRGLLKTYCLDCHSTADPQGELDLARFASLADVRRDPAAWQRVAEMLDNGEMPPKDAAQPTADERRRLRSWVGSYLAAEALANSGDPGPVPVRRLSNAEYTYTIRDLTGVPLDPAREFPADGAAGEGFTNAGAAGAMSPALLQKYFDAGKDVAAHAVLLPNGIRFSTSTSRRDWTEEALAEIRRIYARDTASAGASQVNLQGIQFETNGGGRLPVEAYMAALQEERQELQSGQKTLAQVAAARSLNAKYLTALWQTLNATPSAERPSILLDQLRTQWKALGDASLTDDVRQRQLAEMVDEIHRTQQGLFQFSTIGHIGKVGGPKAWMEAIQPLASRVEVRAPLGDTSKGTVKVSLATTDAGDGSAGDFVVWERPRLVAPGRPDVLLRDLPSIAHRLEESRKDLFAQAERCLNAADEASRDEAMEISKLAAKYDIAPETLAAWFDYLGMTGTAALGEPITQPASSIGGYDFATAWTGPQALSVVANSSDQHVRIPGNLPPHSIAVHPSPSRQVCVGWKSPVASLVTISGHIQHAHAECGNGILWSLEVRRGRSVQRLASGRSRGGELVPCGSFSDLSLQTNDVVVLVVSPRDGNHSCDLTGVELSITSEAEQWSLTKDVSGDLLAGNPHADHRGRPGVWHFFSEPAVNSAPATIPAGSVPGRWQLAADPALRRSLAEQFQRDLQADVATFAERPFDAEVQAQVRGSDSPLMAASLRHILDKAAQGDERSTSPAGHPQFGRHPDGSAIDPESLCFQAPSEINVEIPSELANGAELVATCSLHPSAGAHSSAQVRAAVRTGDDRPAEGLMIGPASTAGRASNWTANRPGAVATTPVLVAADSVAEQRFKTAFDDFRQLFPPALCYTKIVPVDEVVTLTLYYREDEPLRRLMLSAEEAARLDAAWDELHFTSRDALTEVDAFRQLLEFASQDGDPKVFEPLRKPIMDRADAFRKQLLDSEPSHLAAVVEFAGRAWRRPLQADEETRLRGLYARLRAEELPHEDSIRLLLARILVAPDFLYRLEVAPDAAASAPISDHELAARLSYFLWSSAPDAELRSLADQGTLHEPEVLKAQARRMLKDAKVRRLATEFACQWLHVYDFDKLDEKSERHFPEFRELRGDMYEEVIQSFVHLFQTDGSVWSIYDSDNALVNARLAKFYGIEQAGLTDDRWQTVAQADRFGRGGILTMAATLAKQSGASRTSPILRGNWVSEVLLGERLPRPPKDVPQLPEEEAGSELTVRQLVEKHVSDERCSHCHARIDPLGFALEGFDAIGRKRAKDLAGNALDTHSKLADGTEFDGAAGLQSYLLKGRGDSLLRQFCRKLLGYSLGRSVQLSDEPLLAEMKQKLEQNEFRISAAVEAIVESRQFREIRGQAASEVTSR